ncbi:MAG: DUF1385 domain-containing protein [Solirubrobacterales bacterium]|nr:DUF1385 domain-containing protein [Solirubrobacterales bacterium]
MAESQPGGTSESPESSATASSNGASANGSGPEQEPLRLGGMALRNGLLIHGPTSWAAAARATDGSIQTASGPKPDFGGNRFAKVPLLRGPLRLAEGFAVVPIARRNLPSSRLPFEDVKVIGAAVATTLLSAVVRGKREDISPLRESIVAVLGLTPALVALSSSELASYHAVEHKAIGGYEQGVDPAGVPKEHQRCGSNLIVPMMTFSVLGQVVVNRLFERPGRIVQSVAGLLGLSLSVETFVHAERHPDSPLGRAIHAAGDGIQKAFATREPTDEQLEVGVAALAAALAAESG